MRHTLAMLLLLLLAMPVATLAPSPQAYAQAATQDLPPLPRPRPDRDAQPATQPPASNGSANPAADAIAAVTSAPQQVELEARITPEGAPIPDGLVWRVFSTKPDASGNLALVQKLEGGTADMQLPPGEYVVHVAYGRAQTSETMSVAPGTNDKSFVIEAGALRLNSAVTGDIAIPENLLKFDILTGGDDANRTPIAEAVAANDIVTLNAGTYHIVSHFGDINAVVRADLRVEPGQLTDATLYHHAAQVSFKLVSQAGGEAIADVEWTVKSDDGTVLFTNLGAFPTTVLAAGTYEVSAEQGEQTFSRKFDVTSGAPQEIEVLTAAN